MNLVSLPELHHIKPQAQLLALLAMPFCHSLQVQPATIFPTEPQDLDYSYVTNYSNYADSKRSITNK